ncbi:hypothetical protein HK105_205107 [Polyrhizophydium stewartii]|uniref:Tetratricopeptide repeat protein n=1 Tax=Polyrhizophydium stewartii TaxID=2732419 RepID=A0ABR4N6T8_9FUNG|nr:hypothetical protein HK105_005036 [Polyrhizophydium stewartii]
MSTRGVRLAAAVVGVPVIAAGAAYGYTQWHMRRIPVPARKPLRRALLAHNYGIMDAGLASTNYEAAIRESLAAGLPMGSDVVTGIIEHLADYYRKIGAVAQRRETLERLVEAVAIAPPGEASADREQRLRRALKAAQWSAEAAEEDGDGAAAQAHYESIVALSMVSPRDEQVHGNLAPTTGRMQIGNWATPRQVGSSLEQLGRLYSAHGHPGWAAHAYQRALEMLELDTDLPQVERRCRSSILHNNLAEVLTQVSSGQTALAYALELALLSASIAREPGPRGACAVCEPVALYNAGSILGLMGQRQQSQKYLQLALARSNTIGYAEGAERARRALETA